MVLWVGSVAIALFCWFLGCQEELVPEVGAVDESGNKETAGFTKDLPKMPPEELRLHSHEGDLWIAVDGVVCDLTDFASVHPGGVDVLLQHAGSEAGDAFREVGHSSFAVAHLRARAVAMLVAGAEGGEADISEEPAAAGLLGRLFTKEDFGGYNLHKILGVVVLLQYFFRIGVVLSCVRIEGRDQAWFGPDYLSLATVWMSALLQFTSFRFHVPRHRILGSPMIWQEWRAHNLIFVMRHVLAFTIRWYIERVGALSPHERLVAKVLAFGVLLAQLRSVDIATDYLREDKHESLTATWPFWRGCPAWVERFIKFFYNIAQFQASSLVLNMESSWLYMGYLVIFPFQLASLLMTLVRKGLISTTGYHIGYLWSLLEVVFLSQAAGNVLPWFTLWTVLYCIRVAGLSKYGLWIGVMTPQILCSAFPVWAYYHQVTMNATMLAIWLTWAVGQWLFRVRAVDTRSRRYLENRPKTLVLVKRERVSDSLVWLRFQLPRGFTTGLTPGQHVRVHCPNPSKGLDMWNGRRNPEAAAKTLSRSYTPVSAPDAPNLDLLVRVYPPSPDAGFPKAGRCSSFLGERLQIGEQVHVSGPHGHKIYLGEGLFLIGRDARRARQCAALVGGSGVTPALALLRELRVEAREVAGRPPAVSRISIVHVTRTEGESLPFAWYEPDVEAESSVRCTTRNFTTAGLGSGEEATAAKRRQLAAALRETFPEPADDVVVLLCGPQHFVSELCRPLVRELGYEHVVVMW